MDSRERTLLALHHEEADRVPIDVWASRGTRDKIRNGLGMSLEEFLDANDVDLRYIEGPRYIGPALADRVGTANPSGTAGPAGTPAVDIWGVPRTSVVVRLADRTGEHREYYEEVARSPLQGVRTRDEVEAYSHWPSADWFDYSDIRAQCERVRSKSRVVVFMGDRLNRLAQLKPAMYLRGAEQIFLDLVDNPDIASAIFARIASFYREYGARILEAARGAIDILCTGDDFGSQNGPLVSPAMWRTFLRAGFRDFIELGKAHGAVVMHHTCGAVADLVPDMIDCGLDILQSLQPEASGMDPRTLKAGFGDRLCFHGGVSIQRVLPRGTPGEIGEHVRDLFAAMAPGGGFIACTSHNIQADVPLANVAALLDAYRAAGHYPRTV